MTTSHKRRALMKAGAAIAGGAALGVPTFAVGQGAAGWPSRPVRIVVPYGTGGTADMMARLMGHQLSTQLGQPFVIENKGGASTTIGAADVETATHLHIAANAPVAEVRRVFNDPEGVVIYLAEVTYKGDAIRLEMNLRV